MKARIVGAILLLLLTLGAWGIDQWLMVEYDFSNVVKSLFAITIVYIFLKVIIRAYIDRKTIEEKAKYLFRRLNNSAFYIISVFWLLTIWVENTETLLLSYGLLSAAVAFALQDVFKDIIGGFVLLGTGNYRVGDRIEVGDLVGDVVKINLLYTTVMEIKNWVAGDQPTGRLSIIPNGVVTKSVVNNYTKDHEFIWDEIVLPLTYESDWKEASQLIKDILIQKQKPFIENAKKQIETLSKNYYLKENVLDPSVFFKITDNWIELHLRYITETHRRRVIKSEINEMILSEIQKNEHISIASSTMRIFQ